MTTKHLKTFIGVALICIFSVTAQAKELVIGSRADPAVDPHYQWLSTNVAYSQHIFDSWCKRILRHNGFRASRPVGKPSTS